MAAGPIGRVLGLRLLPDSQSTESPSLRAVVIFDTNDEAMRMLIKTDRGMFKLRDQTKFKCVPFGPRASVYTPARSSPFEDAHCARSPSRVLCIVGPASAPIMTKQALVRLFSESGVNDEAQFIGTKDIIPSDPEAPPQRLIEWHFCEWREQARLARLVLKTVNGLLVDYGSDPCTRRFRPHKLTPLQEVSPPPPGRSAKIWNSHTLLTAGANSSAKATSNAVAGHKHWPTYLKFRKYVPQRAVEASNSANAASVDAVGGKAEPGRRNEPGSRPTLDLNAQPNRRTKPDTQVPPKSQLELEDGHRLHHLDKAAEKKPDADLLRKDFTHPALDLWARALAGKVKQQEEEYTLLKVRFRRPPVAPSEVLSAPVPRPQDPSSGSPGPTT